MRICYHVQEKIGRMIKISTGNFMDIAVKNNLRRKSIAKKNYILRRHPYFRRGMLAGNDNSLPFLGTLVVS